jgi:aspartate carbamoyltransferase
LFQASFSASPAAWKGKHVLSTQQFNRDSLDTLFGLADYFKLMVKTGKPLPPYLEGKHLACVFMEPSTRTSSSFQSAMLRLGGTTIQINESGSSSEKGETLEDTIRCLESYADALVLRHPEKGAAARAAAVCHKAILNAGDGVGEHPTQALLDMYTIRSELMNGKKIFNSSDASGFEVMDGKTISLVGDLKNGRTVHSLATLLARNCPGVKLRLVSPPQLGLPQSVMNELKDSSMSCVSEHEDLDAVISSTDVLYMTRVIQLFEHLLRRQFLSSYL